MICIVNLRILFSTKEIFWKLFFSCVLPMVSRFARAQRHVRRFFQHCSVLILTSESNLIVTESFTRLKYLNKHQKTFLTQGHRQGKKKKNNNLNKLRYIVLHSQRQVPLCLPSKYFSLWNLAVPNQNML